MTTEPVEPISDEERAVLLRACEGFDDPFYRRILALDARLADAEDQLAGMEALAMDRLARAEKAEAERDEAWKVARLGAEQEQRADRLLAAINLLAAEGVISDSRARELTGLRLSDHRAWWRRFHGDCEQEALADNARLRLLLVKAFDEVWHAHKLYPEQVCRDRLLWLVDDLRAALSSPTPPPAGQP